MTVRPNLNFFVTQEQLEKLKPWLDDQNEIAIEKQRAKGMHLRDPIVAADHENGYPYTGAIGGSLTYSFTPTGIGEVCKVKHALTNEEIDLTDYDSW